MSGAHSNVVRVDELIRTWLRDRRKIQQQREKKLKDQLRADRNFLKQLQVASGKKDDEGKSRKQDAEDKGDSPNGKEKTTPRSMAASLGLDPKNSRIHLKDSEEEVPALCPLPSRVLFGDIIHHLMLSSDRHHGPQAEVSDEATNTH